MLVLINFSELSPYVEANRWWYCASNVCARVAAVITLLTAAKHRPTFHLPPQTAKKNASSLYSRMHCGLKSLTEILCLLSQWHFARRLCVVSGLGCMFRRRRTFAECSARSNVGSTELVTRCLSDCVAYLAFNEAQERQKRRPTTRRSIQQHLERENQCAQLIKAEA